LLHSKDITTSIIIQSVNSKINGIIFPGRGAFLAEFSNSKPVGIVIRKTKSSFISGLAASLRLMLHCKRSTTIQLFLFFHLPVLGILLFHLPNTPKNRETKSFLPDG
jgi:hypothetical protein